MGLRKEFVLKALSKESSIAALCRDYGISRKTGYKWIERFRERGFDGLLDESRRPDSSPGETSIESTADIVKLRQTHPTWGPRKIHALLAKRLTGIDLPSSRTISRILDRNNLPKKKRRYRPASKGLPLLAPHCEVLASNDLWTVDFKGWWYARDGRRCDPLTIRDSFSRMVFALRLVERTRTADVQRVFEELFAMHGLPKAIQSDNGPPFASVKAIGGLSKLSAWWITLGIEVVRSRPGCPQDNGAHERMHADIRAEVQAKAASTVQEQQLVCDAWRLEFNHVRPHEALGMLTPADVYRPSPRWLSHVMNGVGYAGYPAVAELRIVRGQGAVAYKNKRIYVSLALVNYEVAIEPCESGLRFWFHRRLLGEVPIEVFNRERVMTLEPIVVEKPVLIEEVSPLVTPG